MPDNFSPELQAILAEEGMMDAPAMPPEAPSTEIEMTVTPELQEEGKGFDFGKAALDVTLGVPEAVGLGAVNAVGETIEGLYGAADWAVNKVGGDLPDKEYTPYEPRTQTGKVLEPIARFIGGFIGAGKFLNMAGWAKKGKKAWDITRAAVQGGLADFFVFDAHEQRLSNLIQEQPALRNPISEYLQAKPEDSEAEGRFKNVVEGLGLGVATEGLITALKQLKHLRALRKTKGDAGAAEAIAKQSDIVDAELDKLFPRKVETKVEGKILPKAEFDEEKAVAYAQEVNRVLGEGGDPTKISLQPYIDSDAFQSADKVEALVERMVEAVRKNDPVISHPQTIEEAEKQFSQTIANLADLKDVSKDSLTQTLLKDAETIREAGIRGVVVSNVLDAIAREADRLAPLVKNLDDDAAKQLISLQEAAYRIVPADALVGSELGRSLNTRKIRSTFAKDAAELLRSDMDPLALADAIQNAKNAYAKSKTLQLALDTITRVRVNAMLSGPVTQMVNITSNLIKTGLAPSEYILGGLVQSTKNLEAGQAAIRQGLGIYRGMWAAMSDSWRMAGSAIKNRRGVFRGGEYSQLDVFGDLSKAENVITNPADALKYSSLDDLRVSSQQIQEALEAGDYGKLTSLVWSTGLRTLGVVADIPTTLLNGADEFFLNLNGRGMLYSHLTEQGLKNGLPPGRKELSQFIEEGFQKYFSQNGALLKEDEIGQSAFAYATDSNFSTAMTEDTIFGRIGLLMKRGSEAGGGFGFAMQNITPFIRTPVNLIEDVFNHVPGVNMIFNRQIREDLQAGGLRQAKRIGEMVTGSMFLATAAGLVSQGHITGSGPTNPQLRNQLRKTGWKPYSLRIPDEESPGGYRYFELLRFDPYSTYFTLVADFLEAQQAGARGDDQEFYSKLVGSVTNNLSSKKYLTGLIDTMDLIGGMAYGDMDSVEKYINDLAGSFVPSALKTVREIEDPLAREARSMVDAMRNRTPFLSEEVPVQYDFRGKPALTPILSLYTRSDMDAVDVEVLKLTQLGGQVDVVSSRDRRLLSEFRNTDGQTAYERMGELMGEVGLLHYREDMEGKTLTEALKEVIQSDEYQSASDPFTSHEFHGQGGKVMMLRNEIARYRDAAMERLLLEGFKNENGEGLARVLEVKKMIPKVHTQDDLQQFLQGEASGGEVDPDTYAPIFQFGQ